MSRTPVVSVVPQAVDLALYAGDGVALRLSVSSLGAPLALTGAVTAQVRSSRDDASVPVDFTVDLAEADAGIVGLTLTGAQTATLGAFKGAWDAQWHPLGGEPRTIVQGAVTCVLDVTRP
jgi:hypothetical protein